ncbi:Uncharacterised protein [Mycobacteroides abscessus subsp. abscessus]|mgnify:FL=1|nr:Uncharacterised protein [Mycobacteroides abscessus subsp. abscessus]
MEHQQRPLLIESLCPVCFEPLRIGADWVVPEHEDPIYLAPCVAVTPPKMFAFHMNAVVYGRF